MPHSENAMTLIEILIAMILFSVIATMGYGGLSNIIDLQREQKRIQREQEDIQRVLLIISRDFYQIVPRPVRNNTGAVIASVHFDSNNNTIEFTRSGNSHPITFNRSQFLRVGYTLEDDQLYRLHWHHLDRVLSTIPEKNLLLRDIDSIKFRFMDKTKIWKKTWSPRNVNEIPNAIEMILTMQNEVEYLHTFPLVQP
jgi:general secretion pathway protein J